MASHSVFTEEGIRNTKFMRLASIEHEDLPETCLRNTVKEELVLEYAEHFRAQLVQLYPTRPPLLLVSPNEAGIPKFVCTTIRPTQPAVKELYDLPACAKFVSSYIRYEPLDPPTELPSQLPSPATVLASRVGDSFDVSIVLASFLIGNGYDAYVVVGKAPKWVTLKYESLLRCDVVAPPDALDRKAHISPSALQLVVPVEGGGASAAASSSSNKYGAARTKAQQAADAENKYKAAPLGSLESEYVKAHGKSSSGGGSENNAASANASAAATTTSPLSWESDDENSDEELERNRAELPPRPSRVPALLKREADKAADVAGRATQSGGSGNDENNDNSEDHFANSNPSSDPLYGQRVHAWVLVRGGGKKREVEADTFIEASTGTIYPASNSPYLAVESLFNHKNFWVNMQAQPLIPSQVLDSSSLLAPALRNALKQSTGGKKGGGIRGSGGMIAASAVASTLAGSMGAEMQASVRPEMLSPYMSALSSMKEVQHAEMVAAASRRAQERAAAKETAKPAAPAPKGGKDNKDKGGGDQGKENEEEKEPTIPDPPLPPGQYPPGAPILRGPAAAYTLQHPRPPKPKEVAAPPQKKNTAPRASSDEGGSGEGGEGGNSSGSGEGGSGEEGGADGTTTATSSGEGGQEGGEAASAEGGAAAGTEGSAEGTSSSGNAATTSEGNGADAGSSPRPGSSKPGTASGGTRSGSRGATRSKSQGGIRVTSRPWKDVFGAQVGELQNQLVDVLSEQADQEPSVATMKWDLENSDDWEFVLIAYENTSDDAEETDENGGNSNNAENADATAAQPTTPAPAAIAGESKDGDHMDDEGEGDDEGGSGEGTSEKGDSSPSASATDGAGGGAGANGRTSSAGPRAANAKPIKDKYAGLVIELDGQHILDLPPSWSGALFMSKIEAKNAVDVVVGSTRNYHKARLQQFQMHSNSIGLVSRHTAYADIHRLITTSITEVFSRRKDGMYKRVRILTSPNSGTSRAVTYGVGCGAQIVEEHFERGRSSGLALIVEELGTRKDTYYYAGSRIDGLLMRSEIRGKKISEIYAPHAPNRLWYRSFTFGTQGKVAAPIAAPHTSRSTSNSRGSAPAASGFASGTLTIEIDAKVEIPLRKMAEKYRRDPTIPAWRDVDKIVYSLTEGNIIARFHTPQGRIARGIRQYSKATGEMVMITTDPTATALKPFDLEQEFRRFSNMEKDCHTAGRSQAKLAIELQQLRVWEVYHVELEKNVFDIALERALSGVALEEETERKQEDLNKEPDYLLPFLLAAKAADPGNPDEKSARKADRDCRAAYKERLQERIAIIKRRQDDETEKLHKRQQAFSRSRDHTEAAEKEFETYVSGAEFRISILEQRLERQEKLLDVKVKEMEDRLRKDQRLAILYDPAGYKERQAELAMNGGM